MSLSFCCPAEVLLTGCSTKGALIQEVTAIHVSINLGGSPSVSTQIATLRRLLLGRGDGELQKIFSRAAAVRNVCLKLVILS